MSKNLQPLNNKELQKQAPTLFTEQPHHEVSDKYHFIPTIILGLVSICIYKNRDVL